MKPSAWIITLLAALGVALAACAKKDQVDTSKLEKSFASAEPASQTRVNQAVTAIKNADYTGALAQLQKVAAKANLTPEQQAALKDVMQQIQNRIAEGGKKAAEGANKAVGDLQKSLPK